MGLLSHSATMNFWRMLRQSVELETGYEIKLCEKPLFGLQDADIKELKCTKDITPIDPEEMDTRIRGYVD